MKLKQILKNYKHAWVFLYVLIYVPWFCYLEKHVTTNYYIIHSPLDDYIPFVEYFIIPYLLWFAFIAVVMGYFFFTDTHGFYRLTLFLFTGMTLFLIICTIFPNGQHLRPTVFERDNMFVDMVRQLYLTDTPTNVLPSIHAFNSIGVSIAIAHSKKLRTVRWIQVCAYIFSGFIVLSTVFLKQHSVTDVIAAIVLAAFIYPFVYVLQEKKVPSLSHQPV